MPIFWDLYAVQNRFCTSTPDRLHVCVWAARRQILYKLHDCISLPYKLTSSLRGI